MRLTPYNPFDLTKVWPHAEFALIEVGILELNRNADNYFAEIEQAAHSPSNVIPGVGFSRTRCSRLGFSPTPMRIAIALALITMHCRSTHRDVQ